MSRGNDPEDSQTSGVMTVQEAANCHGNDKAADVVVRSSRDDDVDAMLAIYLHHIRVGVDPSGSYEIEAPQLADLSQRRKNMQKHRLPHLVADRAGTVVGYAYAEPFRKRPAYRYVVKHSIYVHHEHLRSGIGRLLLPALIDACAASGYRQMIGYIDASNLPSIQLHEVFGFRQVGYLPSIGFKFGQWTDSMIMQRSLGPGATTKPDTWL
jgi:L-amino acid N-acyltransferase YncA